MSKLSVHYRQRRLLASPYRVSIWISLLLSQLAIAGDLEHVTYVEDLRFVALHPWILNFDRRVSGDGGTPWTASEIDHLVQESEHVIDSFQSLTKLTVGDLELSVLASPFYPKLYAPELANEPSQATIEIPTLLATISTITQLLTDSLPIEPPSSTWDISSGALRAIAFKGFAFIPLPARFGAVLDQHKSDSAYRYTVGLPGGQVQGLGLRTGDAYGVLVRRGSEFDGTDALVVT